MFTSETESPSSTMRRSSSMRIQDKKEISAIERNFNKRIPQVPAVNEGSHRLGHEKGAIKKQPQVSKINLLYFF